MGRKSRNKAEQRAAGPEAKRDRSKRPEKRGWSVMTWVIIGVVLVLVASGAGYDYWRNTIKPRQLLRQSEALVSQAHDTVRIDTDKGQIVMEVYPKAMPTTVANFEYLANSGFYDKGMSWHRVEGWVVQTGDPNGDGSGGSDKTIPLESTPALSNVRGAVGMARSDDPNSASSQFYILKADAKELDGRYAIFGRVVSGMDVVDKLVQGDKMLKVTVEPGAGK